MPELRGKLNRKGFRVDLNRYTTHHLEHHSLVKITTISIVDSQEEQSVEPLANVRTKKPGDVSRRSDSTVAVSFCVASDGDDLDPRFRATRPEACSVFSPVQCSIEIGLLSQPPGSVGRDSRPARIKVLCAPGVDAAQRFCMRI